MEDRLQDANRRLAVRFREWFISGMCERCQLAFHESDPVVSVTDADGTTTLMPRSHLPDDAHVTDSGRIAPPPP